MKSKCASGLLALHVILLILAATPNWESGKPPVDLDFFQFSYRNGWGYAYRSDYSLPVVLAYIAAYLFGVFGYVLVRKRVPSWSITLGLLLSTLGLLSFLIEASHWVLNHHLSLIVSCPATALILAVIVVVQLSRTEQRLACQPIP